MNCVIDDELEVLLQQGVDQRGVRDALSVCRQHKRKVFCFEIAISFLLFFSFFFPEHGPKINETKWISAAGRSDVQFIEKVSLLQQKSWILSRQTDRRGNDCYSSISSEQQEDTVLNVQYS